MFLLIDIVIMVCMIILFSKQKKVNKKLVDRVYRLERMLVDEKFKEEKFKDIESEVNSNVNA